MKDHCVFLQMAKKSILQEIIFQKEKQKKIKKGFKI